MPMIPINKEGSFSSIGDFREISDDSEIEPEKKSFGELLPIAFERENSIGSILSEGSQSLSESLESIKDLDLYPDVNQGGVNWEAPITPEKHNELMQSLLGTEFQSDINYFANRISTEGEFVKEIAELRRQRENAKLMNDNGLTGFVAGTVAAILDPVNLIPFANAANRTVRLGKSVRSGIRAGVINAGAGTATSELILQATQKERTVQESLLNIGMGTVFGGFVGAGGGVVSSIRGKKYINRLYDNMPEDVRKQVLVDPELGTLTPDAVFKISQARRNEINTRFDEIEFEIANAKNINDFRNLRLEAGRLRKELSFNTRYFSGALRELGHFSSRELEANMTQQNTEIVRDRVPNEAAPDTLTGSATMPTLDLQQKWIELDSEKQHTEAIIEDLNSNTKLKPEERQQALEEANKELELHREKVSELLDKADEEELANLDPDFKLENIFDPEDFTPPKSLSAAASDDAIAEAARASEDTTLAPSFLWYRDASQAIAKPIELITGGGRPSTTGSVSSANPVLKMQTSSIPRSRTWITEMVNGLYTKADFTERVKPGPLNLEAFIEHRLAKDTATSMDIIADGFSNLVGKPANVITKNIARPNFNKKYANYVRELNWELISPNSTKEPAIREAALKLRKEVIEPIGRELRDLGILKNLTDQEISEYMRRSWNMSKINKNFDSLVKLLTRDAMAIARKDQFKWQELHDRKLQLDDLEFERTNLENGLTGKSDTPITGRNKIKEAKDRIKEILDEEADLLENFDKKLYKELSKDYSISKATVDGPNELVARFVDFDDVDTVEFFRERAINTANNLRSGSPHLSFTEDPSLINVHGENNKSRPSSLSARQLTFLKVEDYKEFLEADAGDTITGYLNSIVPTVEMIKRKGHANSKKFQKEIYDSYREAVNKVKRSAGSDKDKQKILAKLQRDYDSDSALVRYIVKKLTNSHDTSTGHRGLDSVIDTATTWSYLSNMGGVTVSSFPDMANFLGKFGFTELMSEFNRFLDVEFKKLQMSKDEAGELLVNAEIVMNTIRNRFSDLDRVGASGDSKFENVLKASKDLFGIVNMSVFWNQFNKDLASRMSISRSAGGLIKWAQTGKISKVLRADLQKAGFDADKARAFARYFNESDSEMYKGKTPMVNVDRWRTMGREANEMLDTLLALAKQDADTVIATKGAEGPTFILKKVATMIFQFHGFPYAQNHRVLIPMSQRVMQGEAAKGIQFLTGITAMGYLVLYLYRYINGRMDLFEQEEPLGTFKEALDRSGAFAMPFMMNNLLEKFNMPGLSSLMGGQRGGRLHNAPTLSVLGPSLGNLENMGDFMLGIRRLYAEGYMTKAEYNAGIRMLATRNLLGWSQAIGALGSPIKDSLTAKPRSKNKKRRSRNLDVKL